MTDACPEDDADRRSLILVNVATLAQTVVPEKSVTWQQPEHVLILDQKGVTHWFYPDTGQLEEVLE